MAPQTSNTSSARLLRLKEVMTRVGLGRATVYRMIQADQFPRPVKIGGASTWVEGEIQAWINERIAERGGLAA